MESRLKQLILEVFGIDTEVIVTSVVGLTVPQLMIKDIDLIYKQFPEYFL